MVDVFSTYVWIRNIKICPSHFMKGEREEGKWKRWYKLGYTVYIQGNVTINPPVQLLCTNKNIKKFIETNVQDSGKSDFWSCSLFTLPLLSHSFMHVLRSSFILKISSNEHCFKNKFLLGYFHDTEGVSQWQFWLDLHCTLPSLPLCPSPSPLRQLQDVFLFLFFIGIWSPSTIYHHLNLLR
jgi:hypothetical protein